MRYVVTGTDAGGRHKRAVVEAVDETAAKTMVQGVGITVTGVEHMTNSHPEEGTAHHSGSPHVSTSSAVRVPDYPGLHIGAWVIRLFGLGAVALGVFILYPTIRDLMYSRKQPDGINPADLRAVEPIALTAFSLFGVCAVLFVLAAIAIAVRDIARNSFRR